MIKNIILFKKLEMIILFLNLSLYILTKKYKQINYILKLKISKYSSMMNGMILIYLKNFSLHNISCSISHSFLYLF